MNKFQGVDSEAREGSFTLCNKAIDQQKRERERERERSKTRTNKDVVRKSIHWQCGHTLLR